MRKKYIYFSYSQHGCRYHHRHRRSRSSSNNRDVAAILFLTFYLMCNAMFTFIYFHCLYFYVCSISFHVFCFSSSSLPFSISLSSDHSFLLSAFRCVYKIYLLANISIRILTLIVVYWNVVDAIHSHSMRVERCEYKPIHGLPFVYSARDHTKQAMNAVAAVAASAAAVYEYR